MIGNGVAVAGQGRYVFFQLESASGMFLPVVADLGADANVTVPDVDRFGADDPNNAYGRVVVLFDKYFVDLVQIEQDSSRVMAWDTTRLSLGSKPFFVSDGQIGDMDDGDDPPNYRMQTVLMRGTTGEILQRLP